MYFLSLLAVRELHGQSLRWLTITIKNVEKNWKINSEKYGSFSKFRTSTEKSVMLATPYMLQYKNLLQYRIFSTPINYHGKNFEECPAIKFCCKMGFTQRKFEKCLQKHLVTRPYRMLRYFDGIAGLRQVRSRLKMQSGAEGWEQRKWKWMIARVTAVLKGESLKIALSGVYRNQSNHTLLTMALISFHPMLLTAWLHILIRGDQKVLPI